jgi:predicted DNA-binding transcriptional regulator AlpA
VTVSSYSRLSDAKEINDTILRLVRAGQTDEEIAAALTDNGHRAPNLGEISAAAVRKLRLDNHLLRFPKKSQPRHQEGFLTVPQLAEKLHVEATKIYRHIRNGTIEVKRDEKAKCYLFPDKTRTLAQVRQLLGGKIQRLAI